MENMPINILRDLSLFWQFFPLLAKKMLIYICVLGYAFYCFMYHLKKYSAKFCLSELQ